MEGAYEALNAFVAYEAVVAYEALNAFVAYDEVPNNDPVKPDVAMTLPVIYT